MTINRSCRSSAWSCCPTVEVLVTALVVFCVVYKARDSLWGCREMDCLVLASLSRFRSDIHGKSVYARNAYKQDIETSPVASSNNALYLTLWSLCPWDMLKRIIDD